MADVFISYKKEDRALAQRVEAALKRERITSWWDTSLHPRESWDAIIQREIAEAAAVIVIWTPRSVRSEWVRIEATYGKQNGKLVPLLAEPCDIPLAFTLTQAAHVTDWNGAARHEGWHQALEWIVALMDSDDGPDPLPEFDEVEEAEELRREVPTPLPEPIPAPASKQTRTRSGFNVWLLGAIAAIGILGFFYLQRGAESRQANLAAVDAAIDALRARSIIEASECENFREPDYVPPPSVAPGARSNPCDEVNRINREIDDLLAQRRDLLR